MLHVLQALVVAQVGLSGVASLCEILNMQLPSGRLFHVALSGAWTPKGVHVIDHQFKVIQEQHDLYQTWLFANVESRGWARFVGTPQRMCLELVSGWCLLRTVFARVIKLFPEIEFIP